MCRKSKGIHYKKERRPTAVGRGKEEEHQRQKGQKEAAGDEEEAGWRFGLLVIMAIVAGDEKQLNRNCCKEGSTRLISRLTRLKSRLMSFPGMRSAGSCLLAVAGLLPRNLSSSNVWF
jgi:hypothetical protein